jgi:hypothetical protein
MVSKQFAIEQVKRFSGLDFFPTTDEAFEELVLAVMTAKTEEVCIAGCAAILLDARKCPKPTDIRRQMVSTGELPWSADWTLPGELCVGCQSLGYIEQAGVFVACPLCQNGLDFPEILLEQLNRKPHPKGSGLEQRIRKAVRMGEILSR